jgi:hypothetical protein
MRQNPTILPGKVTFYYEIKKTLHYPAAAVVSHNELSDSIQHDIQPFLECCSPLSISSGVVARAECQQLQLQMKFSTSSRTTVKQSLLSRDVPVHQVIKVLLKVRTRWKESLMRIEP